ncbi:MAG: phage portal protein [Roseovarius sp.]|nr:phage portal protein [Roseovarius sp.]
MIHGSVREVSPPARWPPLRCACAPAGRDGPAPAGGWSPPLWLAWTDEADADGLTDFYTLQAMVAREMFVAAECFVRMRARRAEDGLLVPLQVQLLQSEMLPFEKTGTAPNGNRIRCGIEFDLTGKRLAYHFRRHYPGDSTDPEHRGLPGLGGRRQSRTAPGPVSRSAFPQALPS